MDREPVDQTPGLLVRSGCAVVRIPVSNEFQLAMVRRNDTSRSEVTIRGEVDNWCDPSKVGNAFFLDTFSGVLQGGDNVIASGSKLKAASNDVIPIKLQQSAPEFHVNGVEVGLVQVDPLHQLRVAAQMWDRGIAIACLTAPGVAAKPDTLYLSSLSFTQSPIESPDTVRICGTTTT